MMVKGYHQYYLSEEWGRDASLQNRVDTFLNYLINHNHMYPFNCEKAISNSICLFLEIHRPHCNSSTPRIIKEHLDTPISILK